MANNNYTTNQINIYTIRYYSSNTVQHCDRGNYNMVMNPWYLTGFVEAERCFTLGITRNNKCKTGWSIQLFFQIDFFFEKDKYLLDQIKNYFDDGKIYKHSTQCIIYRVLSIKDLQVIIDHLVKYPIITQKLADFNLFNQAFNLTLNKEHLTIIGLKKLVAIKRSWVFHQS